MEVLLQISEASVLGTMLKFLAKIDNLSLIYFLHNILVWTF